MQKDIRKFSPSKINASFEILWKELIGFVQFHFFPTVM